MRQILSVLLLLGILSVLVSCLMGSFENQQVAQIEDIVARKTGIAAQNIVINPLSR